MDKTMMLTPTPEEKARMMADCLDSLDPAFKPSTERKDMVLARAEDVRGRVIRIIRPELTKIGVAWDLDTRHKFLQLIGQLYGNNFAEWSHEDLVWAMTVAHTESLMAKIDEQVGIEKPRIII